MNRRSLTIVEVLIAMALMAGIAAIVTPYVLSTLDERAFESAADVTGEQLMLARAHAQATGKSIEVRYRPEESCVEARVFVPWMGRWMTATSERSEANESGGGMAIARTDEQGQSIIAEPWANRSISKSVRIASRRSSASTHPPLAPGLTEADAAAIEAELTSTDEVRLAVFMPDGSALLGDPFWFEDTDGRVGKLTVNPFSGLPMWERLVDLSAARNDQMADEPSTESGVPANGQGEEESHTWNRGDRTRP